MARVRGLNHSTVAHYWANKVQEEGYGHNMYFEGDTIYSYGRHFPIAKHVTNASGEHAVLFTTDNYSNSTAKHKAEVRGASRHIKTFTISPCGLTGDLDRGFNNVLADYQERVNDQLKQALKRRKEKLRNHDIRAAMALVDEANDYIRFFDVPVKQLTMPENLAEFEAQVKADQAAARERDKVRKEEQRIKLAEVIADYTAAFRADGCSSMPYYLREHTGCLLRIDGDTLETSEGADIPLAHAVKLWPYMIEAKRDGIKLDAPIKLGVYRLDSFNADLEGTLRVGCHTIRWSEIELIAKQLGLI